MSSTGDLQENNKRVTRVTWRMEHHGTSWNIMEHHGTSWNYGIYGTSTVQRQDLAVGPHEIPRYDLYNVRPPR